MLYNDPHFKDREYATLDETAIQIALRDDPDEYLASSERATIDEAQKSRDLFPAVRRALHKDRKPGRFILSGSSSLPLRESTAESLAGDAVYLHMGPLTRRELLSDTERPPFIIDFIKNPRRISVVGRKPVSAENVLRGGMPGVAIPPWNAARAWLSGYEQTYLARDVLYLSRIENLSGFMAMLELLSTRTAQVLNVDQLARDLGGLGRNTVDRYIDLLEALFVVNRLQPYSRNVTVKTRKRPKIVFSDSGLACYLAGVHDVSSHPLKGFMYETYAYQNLAGILDSHEPDWRMYYWRAGGTEVDFVIDTRDGAVGVEVKSSGRLDPDDAKPLRALMKSAKECNLGILAYNGAAEVVSLGGGVWAIPLDTLLS
jgi:hypothetical protein